MVICVWHKYSSQSYVITLIIILYKQLICKLTPKYNKRTNSEMGGLMKDILAVITRHRLQRGGSEYDLAKNSGLTQSTISTWYRKNQTPTIQTLDKVCKGFGITLSQFFDEGGEAVSLTDDQREMLDHWSALTPMQREAVLKLLENM